MIHERIAQGMYVKDIAAEMGVHPRTVVARCGGVAHRQASGRQRARASLTPTSRWWIGCLGKECGTGR